MQDIHKFDEFIQLKHSLSQYKQVLFKLSENVPVGQDE